MSTRTAFVMSMFVVASAWAVDPPVAFDDGFTANEGGAINEATPNVLDNDTDTENDTLSAVVVSDPSNATGTFDLAINGAVTYVHDGSETTTDSFTYQATDIDGASNIATVTITIAPTNDKPVINGLVAPLSTPEETDLTIVLTDLSVTDPDNTYPADFTLSVQNGTNYSRSGNTITPDANFNGNLTVPVIVNDGTINSDQVNITVSVDATNDKPVINGLVAPLSTPEETDLTIVLTDLSVTDPDNTYPADFTLSVQNGTNYSRSGNTITPDANFNGNLTVPVIVNDGTINSDQVNITVSVGATNDKPVINGLVAPLSTPEETDLTIVLTDLSVTDPDNTYPADFTLSVQNGTNYSRSGNTITPDADFNGNLTVPVIVNDGAINSDQVNITVSVDATNDKPVINGLVAPLSTPEETDLTIVLTDLSVTDPDNTYPDDFTLSVQNGTNYSRSGNTITPDANFNGNLTVPVIVNDGTINSDQVNITVSVDATNDKPVINGLVAPLSTPEETDLTIVLTDLSVTDPDNTYPADFTLSVQNGTNYSRSGNTITPDANFNGNLTVPVIVNDGTINSDQVNITVSVGATNDKPVINGLVAPLSTPEETDLTIVLDDLSVTDPDNTYPDDFTLSVQNGTNYSRSGNTITPDANFNGNLTVPVIVNDGTINSDQVNITVSVDATNDKPVINGLVAPLSTPEETDLTIVLTDLSVTDPDNTYPADFTLSVQNGTNYSRSGNTITPDANFNGNLTVPVIVNDGTTNSDQVNITVSVDAVNDAPVVDTPIGPRTTSEGVNANINVSGNFSDPDVGDSLTFTATGLPGVLTISSGGVITGIPTNDDVGDHSVTVTARDTSNVPVSDTFTLTITNTNDPPVLDSVIGPKSTNEDVDANIDVSGNFSDPDAGDSLTFTATGLPGVLTISSGGVISGIPVNEDVGPYSVTVTARDTSNASVSDTFTLTVSNTNDPPTVASPIGPQNANEDENYSLDISGNFDDPDQSDSLNFSATGLPGTLTISSAGVISGTPVNADVGPYNVTVTARDTSNAPVSDTFTLTVNNTNDPPALESPIGDRSIDEDSNANINVSGNFSDPDEGDSLTFTATGLPGAMTISAGGVIQGIPTNDDVGPHNITVTARDTANVPVTDSFTLTVINVNDAPSVRNPIANQQTLEDELFELNVAGNFEDVDGDTLTFTASGLPGSLSISSAGFISGAPTNDDVGDHNITVEASDPSLTSVSDTFRLTVTNVNDAPVIVGQTTLITPEETALTITLADLIVTDPDNTFPEDFTLTVTDGVNYTRVDNTITPDDEFAGNLQVPVTVNDGELDSNTQVLSILVTSQNDIPIVTGQVPNPIVSDEDAALTITLANLTVTDPDDTYPDDFTLTLFDGENYSVTGASAITPDPDYNGLLVVQLQVDDPEASSPLFGLSVDVTPVNDAPIITGQSVLQTEEETPLTVTVADLVIVDPDLPAQEQTLTLQPGTGYSLEGNTVTPDENLVGNLLVPATVNDGEADSAVFELSIDVGAVNDKPVIDDQLPLSTPEETALLITLNDLVVSDPDNTYPDDFTLAVQDGTNYTRTGNSVLPAADFNGDLLVPVVVNDGLNDSDAFVLTVNVTAINDVPVITGQAELTTAEDTSLLVLVTDLVVTDPDNVFPTDFSLTLQAGSNYSLSGTTVTPDTNFNGELDVPALVSDGIATSAPFILKVTVSSENDTPIVETPISDQQAVENEAFVFDVSGNFSDSDGDTLTFTASGLPPSGNISIDPDSGVISGTPDFNDTQDFPYEVTVTATDDSEAAVSDGFQLTVAALDRANVALAIEVTPSPAMLQDETRWTFTASNAGPSDATDVALNGNFFGQGLTVSAIQPSDCTVGVEANRETAFTCVIGDLTAGATAFVVLTATRNMPGDIAVAAMAAVQGDLPIDPNTDDNDAQLSVSVASELSNGEVQTLGSSTARSFASGDVDGDGDEDLVVGTAAGQPVEIYRGSGFRLFEEGAAVLPENASTEGIALTDLDGDGDPDLVFANSGGQPDSVYLNDGSGGFLSSVAIGNTDSRDVAVADLDGNGQPDLVFATVQGNPVYLSDGTGGYTPTPDLGASMSLGVASADFNGDGRPDLVFANIGAPSTVWLNDNGSGFENPIELAVGDAAGVVVADFDGNGTPDLAFGRVPATPGDIPANPVLLNDGNGRFQLSAALGAAATTDILAGDIDDDGFVDLVFVNASGTHQIWSGSGNGFSLHQEQIVESDAVSGVLSDLGNDGGLDLELTAGPGAGASLFLNDGFGNLGLGDAVEPVITIRGQANVGVPAGSTYVDQGADAEDNIDGNISNQIVVTNNVNTSLVGAYTVTYNVTDFAGNDAQPVSRTVNVTPAAGTGGGGGGGIGPWALVLLLLTYTGRRRVRTRTIEREACSTNRGI